MTESGITFIRVDAYRIDATYFGDLVATAVMDNYGWGIHARVPNGDVKTVARVRLADPGLARSLALTKLHAAALVRIGGAA